MTLVACLLSSGLASIASGTVINFDDQGLIGPRFFGAPNQHLDITFAPDSAVQFDGGVILTNTTNLPADQTSVYGTNSGFNSNPITVTFGTNINNFFLDVLNGNTSNVTYRIADNANNSRDFTLLPNLRGGQVIIGFAAAGNIVTITALTPPGGFFDFLIDNVTFNAPLPVDLDNGPGVVPPNGGVPVPIPGSGTGPTSGPAPGTSPGAVPEPGSILLMASGFVGLAFAARRFRPAGNIS